MDRGGELQWEWARVRKIFHSLIDFPNDYGYKGPRTWAILSCFSRSLAGIRSGIAEWELKDIWGATAIVRGLTSYTMARAPHCVLIIMYYYHCFTRWRNCSFMSLKLLVGYKSWDLNAKHVFFASLWYSLLCSCCVLADWLWNKVQIFSICIIWP